MSYQRAVVNCKRCYDLAKDTARIEGVTERNHSLCCAQDDSIFQARNEAMKALEAAMADCLASHPDWSRTRIPKIEEALNKCMNCQYKKPEIAEIFDASDGSV